MKVSRLQLLEKHLKFVRGLIFTTILLSSILSWGELPKGFPNLFYRNNFFTVQNFVLDRACFGLVTRGRGYQCNPAYLAQEQRREFNISFLTTNSLSKVIDYGEDLEDKDSSSIIRRALDENEPIMSQVGGALWYQHDWWALVLTPARFGLATDVRNEALPEMTTSVTLEQELMWRFGLFVSEDTNWQVGANLRYVKSKFFNDRLEILSASVGTQKFSVKESEVFYFEPSVAYAFDSPWSPTLSATLTDLKVSESGDEVETSPILELAYSTRPDFLDGKGTSSLQFTVGDDLGRVKDRVAWAAIYALSEQWGLSFLLASEKYGIGLEGNIDSVVLGIGFKSEDIDFGGAERETIDQLLFNFGLVF